MKNVETDDDLLNYINEPSGYSLPTDEYIKPEDLVVLTDYPPEVRHYIKDIFIDSYPAIISTHSTDRGNMSKYLGNYCIKLKPGQILPQHKKLYYLSNLEKLQMQSILEFLLKNGTIERANTEGDSYNNYASPAYLIPKADKNACPRLIVNFSQLNPCLQAEPALLPTAESLIHKLRDKYLFSSSDMANAFHSISLDPSCRDLTLFSTPLGSFRHASLPTGIKTSPESLSRFMDKVLHYEVDRDVHGNPIMEDSKAKLTYSPILEVQAIYDDFIIGSDLAPTYSESLNLHFKILKKVMGRIHTHEGKISLKKSQFFKSRVNFFGVFISHNFVCVDQRRIQKLLDSPMPTTPKLMRAFLGLLNSLRVFLRFDILNPSEILTPLTSSKLEKKFNPTPEQCAAFKELKQALAKGPIFSKLVDLSAPKVILTDAAGTDRGSFSAVLGQIVRPERESKVLPVGYNLEDPIHQQLYDQRMPVQPLPLQLEDEDIKTYQKRVKDDQPPEYEYLSDPHLGYNPTDSSNSLGISLKLLLEFGAVQTPVADILKRTSTTIRTTILRHKYIEFIFDGDKQAFQQFIKKLENGHIQVDSKQYIFEALSIAMYRPIVVITNIPDTKAVTEHNADKTKPPFVFLLYHNNNVPIVRPAMISSRSSYNLGNLRGMFEIVSYASKKITCALGSLHIIELELLGILYALNTFSKLIGRHTETILLTDAKCLYYLFNNNALASSCKLQRWNHKITEALPQLKVSYLKGSDNLADWLSRAYSADLPDKQRIALPRYIKSDLEDVLPSYTIFSIEEWKQFVIDNPNYLGYDQPKPPKLSINALSAEDKAIGIVLSPLQILKKRINMEEIITEQQTEYNEIVAKCLEAKSQSCRIKKQQYHLSDSMLFIVIKQQKKILIPTNLLTTFISYVHLLTNHAGEGKMLLNLQNFYHMDMKKLTRNYCRACYACLIQNSPTKLEKFGQYVTIQRPFETVSLDYIQSLPGFRNYKHILTAVCQLTGTLLAYPMKTLKAREFINVFMFTIYPLYCPKKILCDGGTVFMEKENIVYLAAIDVEVIYSTAYYSQSKGLIESGNKSIKWAVIKLLADYDPTNWVYVLPLVIRLYNTTKIPKTTYSPAELLFGSRSALAQNHFGILPAEDHHPLIQNERIQVDRLNSELAQKLNTAKTLIDSEREKRLSDANKTRIHKEFELGDLVFMRNFSHKEGINDNLRPIFYMSPCRVLEISATSTVIQRIADGYVGKLNNNHLKKYVPMHEQFADLPPSIMKIVQKPFHKLTEAEIAQIVTEDKLPLPSRIATEDPQLLATPTTSQNIPTQDTQPDNDNQQNTQQNQHSDDDSSDEETNFTRPALRVGGRSLRGLPGRNVSFSDNLLGPSQSSQ